MIVEASHLSQRAHLNAPREAHFGFEHRIMHLRPEDLVQVLRSVPVTQLPPHHKVVLNFVRDGSDGITTEFPGDQFEGFMAPGGELDALTSSGYTIGTLSSVELHRSTAERRVIISDVVLHFTGDSALLDVGTNAPPEVATAFTEWFHGLVPQQA